MANIIEKKLPPQVRTEMKTLIAAGLGLFLGLRYNDFLRKLIELILPETHSLWNEFIILIGITIGIVYASILITKALDGK